MAIIGPFGFSGGLNTDVTVLNLPKDQCLALSNSRYIGGTVNSMKPIQAIGGVSEQLLGVGYWESDFFTDAQKGIVLAVNAKIYTAPWDGDTDITKTLTDRTGATTVGDELKTMDATNDLFILAGGSTDARVLLKLTALNANAAVLAGTPPLADIIKVVNNYTFVALNLNAPAESRVYWSNAGDPETWGASSFLDFRKNDGDKITALGRLGEQLVIFKKNSIGILNTQPLTFGGNTLGPLRTFSTSVGCCGRYAVDNFPDGSIAFMGSDGNLYRMDGQTLENLSDRPYPRSSVRSTLRDAFFDVGDAASVKVSQSDGEVICSNAQNFYIYKYIDDLWSYVSGPGGGNIIHLAIAPPTRPTISYKKPYFVFYAAYNSSDATDLYYYEYIGSSNFQTVDLQCAVPLLKENGYFVPACLIVTLEMAASKDLVVSYSFDGGTATSTTLTTPVSGTQNRFVIPINSIPVSTFLSPSSINIRFFNNTDDFSIYPFYISDQQEVS